MGKSGRPRTDTSGDPEARWEYQRRYYKVHKGKAKEYQRLYNLKYKKKSGGRGKANFQCPREAVRMTLSQSDLVNLHGDKFIKAINRITAGERLFTM